MVRLIKYRLLSYVKRLHKNVIVTRLYTYMLEMDNKYIACHFKHKIVRKKILNYTLTSKVVETVNNVLYDQNYNLVLMGI